MPLPHSSHSVPAVAQVKPVSTVLQSAEQPSPLWRLPSSQTSLPPTPAPCSTPSPHLKQAEPAFGQLKPASTAPQSQRQPAPFTRFPSSHTSGALTTPPPHR